MQKAEAKISKEGEKYKHISEVFEQGNRALKIALIQNVGEILKLLISSIMEDEVNERAGRRYEHDKQEEGLYRWGSNPGSVRINGEKVRIQVPRIREGRSGGEVNLESYSAMKTAEPDEEKLLKSIICGVSMNDYHEVVRQIEDSYGLSRSKVSQIFKEQSAQRLEEFINRDLSGYNLIGMFIDGKYLAREQIVIALGVTEEGDKVPLGFVQTTTENARSIKGLLENLLERGLKSEEGLLFVIDGSKGIRKAIEETFGDKAVVKRCAWHKRENMLSYLPEIRKQEFKKKFDQAYAMGDYEASQNAFIDLSNELSKLNITASRSILEGLDELLTLHRLELKEEFGQSFSTTNAIENLNSQLGKYIGKVKNWQNSDQRYRWVASALIEIEQKMKKVNNYKRLYILKERIKFETDKIDLNKNFGTS